jgi:hypothetical protein
MPDRPNRSAVDSAKVKLGSISRFFKKMLSRAPRADDTAKPPKRAGKEARQGQSRGEPARNIRPVATNKAQPVTDKKPRESMPSQVEPKDDKAHRQIADRTAFAKDVIKRIEETAPPRRPSSVETRPKTEESPRSATLSSDTQPSSKVAKTDSSGSSPRINEPSIVDKPSEKQKTEPPAQAPTLQVTEISEESPKLAQVLHDNWLQFGVLGAQAQSRRNWQTATVLSLVLLLLAFCTSLWLYTDRKIQANELERTYLNTQRVYSSLGEATKQNRIIQHELESSKAQTARLQGQLQGFKAEIEQLQNELENSRTQLKAAENELRESGKEVADTRSSDLETLDRLAARIRKLASWLGQQSTNQQTPSGSDNSPN